MGGKEKAKAANLRFHADDYTIDTFIDPPWRVHTCTHGGGAGQQQPGPTAS
jgi:hypothetical protein